MDKQFDELSKSLAEGVSRREAVRKFATGLAGALLVAVGLNKRAGAHGGITCRNNADCGGGICFICYYPHSTRIRWSQCCGTSIACLNSLRDACYGF